LKILAVGHNSAGDYPMKIAEFPGKRVRGGSAGFSLIELMIVVAILGILAVAVGVHINSTDTRLKTFVFNTKALFNQARFEAVKRSRNVYLDFDFDTTPAGLDNGFTIWVDEVVAYPVVYDAAVDTIIKTVVFPGNGPKIYCATCAFPTGGPQDPAGGPDGKTIGDGISAGGDRFQFKADGASVGSGGMAYFYFPAGASGVESVASGPWAIIVNNVGRIKVDEWRSTNGWQSEL
jgi:prepilin-type N-terminal cleavage/methylation domain-containing protein